MGIVKEFREFAMRGNVLDLAVGVIIGAAFGKIINSMVNDMIMPPIGMLLGKVDFSEKKLVIQDGIEAVKSADGVVVTPAVAEVAVKYGSFINMVIEFMIVAFCVFIIIKLFNTARKRFEAEKPAPVPAGPTKEELLLTEIRDILARRG